MYYPDLQKLSCYRIMEAFVTELDIWLAALPASTKDRITAESISNAFEVPYDMVTTVLNEACKFGILENSYAITCPNCEFLLKITDRKHLIEDMSLTTYCYECGTEELEITSQNVYTMYKLIQQPSRPYIIKQANVIHKTSLSSVSCIDELIKHDPSKVNSFFFAPDSSDYDRLKILKANLDGTFKNTTDQGAALDEFISAMFSIVPNFKTSTKLRNSTNQIDCCVKNTYKLPLSILDITGHFFVMECKNENKTPPNTYFRKLDSIMSSIGVQFGIIVSRKKWACTCDELAWEKYLECRRIIINLFDDDFDNIVEHKHNLLDVLHNKSISVITNSRKEIF